MSSVGIELPKELERVTALRERYRLHASEPIFGGANFAPAIAMMTAAIDAATTAMATRDPIACCRAYEALRGFSDD